MRIAVAAALLAAVASVAAAETAGRPEDGFFTRHGALVCRSYFGMKEGRAALRAGDAAWLAKAECTTVQGGLRVALIDAPWSPRSSEEQIWQFRLYTPDGQPGGNWYASEFDIHVFGTGGKYPTEAAANVMRFRLYEALTKVFYFENMKQTYVFPSGDQWPIWVGPSHYHAISSACSSVNSAAFDSRKMARDPAKPECEPAFALPR
jgi:hypothetical protein